MCPELIPATWFPSNSLLMMLCPFNYNKTSRYLLMRSIVILMITVSSLNGFTQVTPALSTRFPLPSEYMALPADQAKMEFLAKIIDDSVNENQLTRVYDWSRQGWMLAEKNKVDSMKGIFQFYIGKAFTYHFNKYDSAIYYYKRVISYFPDKLRKYNVISVREIMERYSDLGNRDSCFAYLDQLVSLIDTMPDTSPRKIGLSQNIATVYQYFGLFKTAIRYFQVAIKGNQQNGNHRGLGLALANLGMLYDEMEDHEKAISTSKKALLYLADVKMPFAQTATNVAEFYTDGQQIDSALVYLEKSMEVEKQMNNNETRIANANILSLIYLSRKKYDSAAYLLRNNLQLLSGSDNHWALVKALFNQSRLDTTLLRYADARKHLTRALDISRKDGTKVLEAIALQGLAALSNKMGNLPDAFKYQSEYDEVRDSLLSQKNKSELADLEISYNTLQKEQKIQLLQKENDLKNLQLKNSRQQIYFGLSALAMAVLISGIVFYQRTQRNKIKTQRLKAELENKVLRLQMNPHFIFNSLNSIENFIMQNEKRLASDYLNKFARLIRMILDSSRNEVVPVAKDMEALQLYIDLEQLRYNNRFSYKTTIDPALAGGDYRVPSLLIQPYVENAIVHGLSHSEEEDLSLTVMATLENEKIKYIVQDNGIGRAQAAAYNQQNKPYHKSVGLKITEDRINLFNNHPEGNGFVHFTDLTDQENRPAGTRVEIILNAQ